VTGPTSNTNNATIAGGSGGAGGRGGDATGGTFPNESDGGNGGSGGDGSAGAKLAAGGAALTNNGIVQGGNGGAGGRGGNASGQSFSVPGFGGTGGNGGAGGAGVKFTGSSGTLTNNGTIQGGNGGTAGAGGTGVSGGAVNGSAGNVGLGGAGVIGSGLTIISNGTIFGGLSGDGVTRANAIVFTGGTNFLGGTGTVGSFTMTSGGTFAPGSSVAGTSMTVSGNLAFQSAAFYFVSLNPSTSTFANVTGNASLSSGAQVATSFASGTYVSKQYTIMTAGSITGTFNPTILNTGLPSGFSTSLSYDPNHVFLNLTLNFVPPNFGGGLNKNQQNVANTLINFFNSTGGIPLVFGSLTPTGLTQVSGESATGSQQTTFDAMNQFMGLLTDPVISGRGDPVSAGGSPTGYAEESLAYAARG
jgi:hypothetical protein